MDYTLTYYKTAVFRFWFPSDCWYWLWSVQDKGVPYSCKQQCQILKEWQIKHGQTDWTGIRNWERKKTVGSWTPCSHSHALFSRWGRSSRLVWLIIRPIACLRSISFLFHSVTSRTPVPESIKQKHLSLFILIPRCVHLFQDVYENILSQHLFQT